VKIVAFTGQKICKTTYVQCSFDQLFMRSGPLNFLNGSWTKNGVEGHCTISWFSERQHQKRV